MALRRNYEEPGVAGVGAGEGPREEYEVLLEFDLKREKEKNLILEERLKNKEIFIQQMKHFQEELTQAYEQCKNELLLAQEKVEYLQNVEFREYTEQIADLKHMLALKPQHHSAPPPPPPPPPRKVEPTGLEGEVMGELGKVTDFVGHFLQMAEHYLGEERARVSKRLKRGWKWVKEVVREWQDCRPARQELSSLRLSLCQMLGVQGTVSTKELLTQLSDKLEQANSG